MNDGEESGREDYWKRDGENLFRLMVESVSDYSIFAIDPWGRILSWNKGAEEVFGGRDAVPLEPPCDGREAVSPVDDESRAIRAATNLVGDVVQAGDDLGTRRRGGESNPGEGEGAGDPVHGWVRSMSGLRALRPVGDDLAARAGEDGDEDGLGG